MYNQSGLEVLMDYSTYIWMAQLFILGMVVGYMRDQIHHIKKDDQEEISYLHGQLGDMTEINDSNVRMKQIFELQLVNQKDSLGKIYEITSSLDQYGAYEVLFYAAQTISKLMNTEDVAVYTVANQSYARLFSFTSPTARKLGNSIRYPEMEAMYTDLKERRVFINKTMDERYPLMAQAIYAEDEMQIILMLWGLPWDRMNLAESNRLTVISYLIQNAVVRANRYLEALREHRYLGNSSILEKEAFTQLVSAFFEAKRNGLTECSLVKITCGEEKYLEAAEVLGMAACMYCFRIQRKRMRWVLLLVLQKLDMRVQLQMGRWPHEHKRNTGVCDPVDRECSDCACVSAGWNFPLCSGV